MCKANTRLISKIRIPYERHYNPRLVYFLPQFSVRFIIKSVNITDNLSTKQGNVGQKSAAYNQEQVIMARVR